ncbi:hypothetical protein ACIGXA_17735 [Streptomyces fildesensis]|uniref:Serine protease n=1 Tax=Streptomyces fildesensis TaxID=375757 RepID=A0ABW8C974_9ACTN
MPESISALAAENRRLEDLLDSGARERLLALSGVFHTAVGLKEVAGRATDTLCLKAYVRAKRPLAEMAPEQVVPPVVDGVPTDVTEVAADFRFAADDSTHRPLVGGIQLTNGVKALDPATLQVSTSRGTLGCFATRTSDGKPVLLTNWHVATANGGRIGDSLFQPAAEPEQDRLEDDFPKRPRSSKNAVATIVDWKVTEKVDGAIARVNTCYSSCCNCGVGFRNTVRDLAVGGGDAIAGTAPGPVIAGQDVFKVGRATDRKAGRVITANFPSVSIPRDGTTYTFTGQMQIELTAGQIAPFATNGDSGSVIVDGSRRVVGLLFATSADETYTLANHISDVVAALGITIKGGERSVLPAEEPEHLVQELAVRFERTTGGRRLSELLDAHRAEVVHLVNHERRVTIAWHRAQGPAWYAALARGARHADYRLPADIAGVTREAAYAQMHAVLVQYGGEELCADLAEWHEHLRAAFTGSRTTGELLDTAGGA